MAGYLYYSSDKQFANGVGTRTSVSVAHRYMLMTDFPDAATAEGCFVSYARIQDFVATLRSAAAPTAYK